MTVGGTGCRVASLERAADPGPEGDDLHVLHRFRIGTRLAVGFGLVLCLMAAAAVAGDLSLRYAVGAVRARIEREGATGRAAARVLAHTRAMRHHETEAFLFAGEPDRVTAAIDQWQGAGRRLATELDGLARLADGEEDTEALAKMRAAVADYEAGFATVSGMVASGLIADPVSARVALGQYGESGRAVETVAGRLAERADRAKAAYEAELKRVVVRASATTYAAVSLAIALAGLLGWVLTRSLTRPIALAVRVAERVAVGDLPELVSVQGRDETARLIDALNGMTAYVRDMAATAQRIADGDLGARVEPRSARDVLGQAFNGMGVYLKAMAAAAEAISQGDLRTSVTPRSDRDVLGWAFSEMTTYLRTIARTAEAVATGDLRDAVRPKADRDALGRAFANMVAGLRGLVGEVRGGAGEVAAAAGGIAAASDDGAKGAEGTQAAIEEMTSTMLELSANVQQVAENAQGQAASAAETASAVAQMVASARRISERGGELTDIARRSGEAVSSGQAAVRRSAEAVAGGLKAVERSATGMARISAAIGGAAEATLGLGQRAQEIGRIVAIIDDITNRTNLLALNAAIIAAQAGEQGRSFAVVAQEVRTLAERSAQSTKEIGSLVAAIQEETLAAVSHMQASRDSVAEGLVLGTEVKDALARIDGSAAEVTVELARIEATVAEVGRCTADIGQATREQASGGAQVERETARLAEMAQEIQRATREQASGAGEVVSLAERMRASTQDHAEAAVALRESAGILDANAERLAAAVARFRTSEGEGRV